VLEQEEGRTELDFYQPSLRAKWRESEEDENSDDISDLEGVEEQLSHFNAADGTWDQRADIEKRVRETVELSVPNEILRRAALNFLAFAIENADEERGNAWYVRKTAHGLRLMTGRLLACEVSRSKLRVSVIGPIGERIRDALGVEA